MNRPGLQNLTPSRQSHIDSPRAHAECWMAPIGYTGLHSGLGYHCATVTRCTAAAYKPALPGLCR